MILTSLPSHRPGRRALRVGALAFAVASSATMSQALPACADDERDVAARTAVEAEATVNALQSQLEGIDASLAQVFIDLQTLNRQIPVTQVAYEGATVTYDQKTCEHATIMGELSVVQGEQSRIDQSLDQATTWTGDTQRATADLVRHKYREGSVDPVVVALTAGDTESITDCAAAADMALCTESQTITTALDVFSSQRIQATRQDAITEHITDLEVKAVQAKEEAKQVKNGADAKLTELNNLKEQAQAKRAEWDAQKGQVEVSLSQVEADYQARSAKLTAIDAANHALGASYVSVSGFRNPLDTSIVATSSSGMRYHLVLGVMKDHSGTDVTVSCGTVIRAVALGYVNTVSSDMLVGNYMDINHGLVDGNSAITEYPHMQAQYVPPGQYVNVGDALGEVGSIGYATGCRLYFGIPQNGSYVEPMDYL